MDELDFNHLQDIHEQLLHEQPKVTNETKSDFIVQVKLYLENAKKSGLIIDGVRERDQLRANLRYWANYIYENDVETVFPNIELVPSNVSKNPLLGPIKFFLPIILLATLIFFAIFSWISKSSPITYVTPTIELTSSHSTLTSEPEIPALNLTKVIPISTTTPENNAGFNFTLLYPANGDFVAPETEFRGEYSNLKPGWAIHLFFLRGDKFFPFPTYYKVPENLSNGTWSIIVDLAKDQLELAKAESYTIVLAISFDENARNSLLSHAQDGIDIDPLIKNVILFNNTSRVVYRKGYKVVSGIRLIYSMYDGKSFDLYSSNLEGKDIIRLTTTPNIQEKWPSLSPDGKNILYVKSQKDDNGVFLDSLYIMDSNGQNDVEVKKADSAVIRYPKWSPSSGSSYIAYAYGDVKNSEGTLWSIRAFNLQTKKETIISGSPGASTNRYFCWLPNGDIIYEARSRSTSTGGFIQTSIDSPDKMSLFFDMDKKDDQQPFVMQSHYGLLLTFVAQNSDFNSDIYLVIDPDGISPLNGKPVKLNLASSSTLRSPVWDEGTSSVFYVRNDKIWVVKVEEKDGNFAALVGNNRSDGEHFGDIVIDTGDNVTINDIDLGYMQAYFQLP